MKETRAPNKNKIKRSFAYNLSWNAFDVVGTKFVSVLVQLVLSRILVPEDFGTIAMISILIGFSELIIDGGLGQSLIRTKKPTSIDYSTVFIFNLIVAFLIYSIIFISSPLIAEFYSNFDLISISRIYTLSLIFNSFVVVNKSILLKNLKFKLVAKINILSVFIGSFVGIYLATLNYGVWSIVFMKLTISLVSSVLFINSQKWKLVILFNWNIFKYHFIFGYKLISIYLIKALSDDMFSVIIGKFYSPSYLGLYNRASVLNKSGVIAVGRTLSNVTFSFFNLDKSNHSFVKDSILNINKLVLSLYFPILIFIFFNSDFLINLLLGSNWTGVIPLFKILLIGSFFEPIVYYYDSLINTYNKPSVTIKINFFVRLFSILIALFFSKHSNLILISYSFSLIIISLLNMYFGGGLINYKFKDQLLDLNKEIIFVIIIITLNIILDRYTNYTELTFLITSFCLTLILIFFLSMVLKIKYKQIFNFFINEI